jgi:hypothetical protein
MLSAREILPLVQSQGVYVGRETYGHSLEPLPWVKRDCLSLPLCPQVLIERYEDGPPSEAVKTTLGAEKQGLVGKEFVINDKEPLLLYPGELLLGWLDFDFSEASWSAEFSYNLSLTFEALGLGLKLNGYTRSPSTGKFSVIVQNATYGHCVEVPPGASIAEVRFIRLETSIPFIKVEVEVDEFGIVDNALRRKQKKKK